MTQEQQKRGDLSVREVRKRKLVYKPEARRALFSKPGVIKKFLELSRLNKLGKTFGDNNFNVTLFDELDGALYFKVGIGNDSFFVKKLPMPDAKAQGGGFGEVLSSQRAKEVLREKGIADVEVIDFQLGYEDGKNRYFISRWADRIQTNLFTYITDLDNKIYRLKFEPPTEEILQAIRDKTKEREELISRRDNIVKALEGFCDFWGNAAYDPKTKKIILFDLYEEKHPHQPTAND